jgi:Phosphatidylglycerol lysyltransferase, C-terminal
MDLLERTGSVAARQTDVRIAEEESRKALKPRRATSAKGAEQPSPPDLSPIVRHDAAAFVDAATQGGVRCWFAYFPRLYYYGGERNHELLWERHEESILVYQVRRRREEVRLNLYLPPFPYTAAALSHAKERMREFNGGPGGRIIFVPEADALSAARGGFEIGFKHEEYLFDRSAVMALEGSAFRTVRSQMSRAAKAGELRTRPYAPSDRDACVALTETWKARLAENGEQATSYRHTMACLADAEQFPATLQQGMVVEIDEVIRGFAFSGHLGGIMGANYICLTDTGVQGLPYLLRYQLMAGFPECAFFNDSTDSDRPGLRDLKLRFRPVEMLGVYTARDR